MLAVLLQICFWPCIWGGETLLSSAQDAPSILPSGADSGPPPDQSYSKLADPGAAAWQTEPWFAFSRDQYRQGTLPLWDPYQAYGEPLAANMQSQPYYPLTLALFAHLTPRTYNFYILARLFVAGICSYFFLRLFLSFTAALTGGIGTMLSGYYIIFITMPHLSVEVLIPAALLAGEHLLRRKSYSAVVWLAIVVMLVFLGGMPESALLLLAFTAAYLLFRIFSDPALRPDWKRCVGLSAAAGVAGVGLSGFLLLPFFEYVTYSFNSHNASQMVGLLHEKLDFSALIYFFPLAFGPLFTNSAFDQNHFTNYVGLISLFLVVIAVGAIRNSLTAFFGGSALVIVLKRYGFIGVNWIGALPLFNRVNFRKYEEPILAFCVWVLCAIAIDRIKRGQAKWLIQSLAAGISGLVLVAGFLAAKSVAVRNAFTVYVPPKIPHWAIRLPAILLALLVLAIVLGFWLTAKRRRDPATRNSRLAVLLLILISAELSLNYIAPLYRHLPSVRRNPYSGGAFVRFLQAKSGDNARVFGRNWVFTPSWPSVFKLSDIRDMDAIYYKKYFPFLRNFLQLEQGSPELITSFLGNGSYQFRMALEKRLLQLSSVKYIASATPFVLQNVRIDEILQQNKGHLLPGKENLVGRHDMVIDGIAREGLGEHPPYERLPYRLKISNSQSKFRFSYGLSPEVFDKPGDGVGFTIELKKASGKIEELFSTYIDPKHNVNERRWMDGEMDLSQYRGQEITLLFSTDPGPRGNSAFDWAAWSDFRFEGEQQQATREFKLVYDAEAKIYEYDNILPRAAIYYDADVENDEAGVLQKLADPSLDVFRTVVLDRSSNIAPPRSLERAGAAVITSYEAQRVEIVASLLRPGILVLNDSDYPGWRVSIDGRPGKWVTANYLFRGVLLNPGKHVVRFEYRPASFYLGAAVSLLTCGLLAGVIIIRSRRDRPRRARDLQTPQQNHHQA
jgi:Bacterial membrane protein YfhO